jgi:hypothetical protein
MFEDAHFQTPRSISRDRAGISISNALFGKAERSLEEQAQKLRAAERSNSRFAQLLTPNFEPLASQLARMLNV